MSKTYNYSIIALAVCSALVDFWVISPDELFYTRDRILHLIISFVIALCICFVFKNARFDIGVLKYTALVMIAFRTVWIIYNFIQYFHIFHGSNTVGIIIFTYIVFFTVWNFEKDKLQQIYIFFTAFNVVMVFLFLLLSFKYLNVINLYSNELKFNFEPQKLFAFFDVITLSMLTARGKKRINCHKKYLFISVTLMLLFTVVQGMCIKGNILYSLSPLQALTQIFSTQTVKRFDYVFTVFNTFNYFGAVILYASALKYGLKRENNFEKN
ncbi:MAG: hypothetical protein IJ339_05415 [Oscillospiraceae bacterium]|nr:hypothetical protein [Oscillospiraceae bacterium]